MDIYLFLLIIEGVNMTMYIELLNVYILLLVLIRYTYDREMIMR
jgi:hypothetical protein